MSGFVYSPRLESSRDGEVGARREGLPEPRDGPGCAAVAPVHSTTRVYEHGYRRDEIPPVELHHQRATGAISEHPPEHHVLRQQQDPWPGWFDTQITRNPEIVAKTGQSECPMPEKPRKQDHCVICAGDAR